MYQLLSTYIQLVAGKDYRMVLGERLHPLLHLANAKGLNRRKALLADVVQNGCDLSFDGDKLCFHCTCKSTNIICNSPPIYKKDAKKGGKIWTIREKCVLWKENLYLNALTFHTLDTPSFCKYISNSLIFGWTEDWFITKKICENNSITALNDINRWKRVDCRVLFAIENNTKQH